MNDHFDPNRLLAALVFLRDGTPSAGIGTEKQAGAALLAEVPGAGRAALRDCARIDEAIYDEVCSQVCLERLTKHDFKGHDAAMAITYIRVCVRTRYYDAMRAEASVQRAREVQREGLARGAIVEYEDAASGDELVEALQVLMERILEQAGARRHRASVWIDYRLGRPQTPGVARDHPEFFRRRSLLYQWRSSGRRYCEAIVEELRRAGKLDDVSDEVVARLLSGSQRDRRPDHDGDA